MYFVSQLLAAVFSIDLLELGIKPDQSGAILGENVEPRLTSSKDRGLHSLLMFIAQYINKILRKVGDKYKFEFVGLIKEDEDKKAITRVKQISGWRTIDEIREEDGDEPFNEEWSKISLHPGAIQIYLAGKSAEQQEKMGQGFGEAGNGNGNGQGAYGEGAENDEGSPTEEAEKEANDVEKSLRSLEEFRKATRFQERVVRHIIS